jgi:Lipocalin-like domain
MKKHFCALAFLLLSPVPGLAQQSLVGSYRMVSLSLEVDGQLSPGAIGQDPLGYLVITPKHYIHSYTGRNRKFGTSNDEKAALWDSLNFYAGPYQVEADKVIVSVDLSFNQIWNGTKQVRSASWNGNYLTLTSPVIPYPRDPTKTVVSRAIWEKIE